MRRYTSTSPQDPNLRAGHHEARIYRATHQGALRLPLEEDRNPQEALHHEAMLELLRRSGLIAA